MSDYTPPKDNELTLVPLKTEPEPDNGPMFTFDPNRSSEELEKLNTADPQSGLIKFWSHSALSTFESCPLRIKLKRVDRIKEPSGPAAERGNAIHDAAEQYVAGLSDDLPDAKKIDQFKARFDLLREHYHEGRIELEQNWGFNSDWNPLEDDGALYKNPELWYLAKLDVFLREDETSATIIDHKSGKMYGNVMKHSGQAMEYTIAAFMRYPELEFVKTEFWYLDIGDELKRSMTRTEAMLMVPRITQRALRLTQCTKFYPNPNARSCRWCHYATSGDCDFAYQEL